MFTLVSNNPDYIRNDPAPEIRETIPKIEEHLMYMPLGRGAVLHPTLGWIGINKVKGIVVGVWTQHFHPNLLEKLQGKLLPAYQSFENGVVGPPTLSYANEWASIIFPNVPSGRHYFALYKSKADAYTWCFKDSNNFVAKLTGDEVFNMLMSRGVDSIMMELPSAQEFRGWRFNDPSVNQKRRTRRKRKRSKRSKRSKRR